jgi:glycerol-3-phosphate acyltransferase PlsY
MISNEIIVFILVAYLLGSIPSAVWVGKFFYNIDIREFGSGNAGATNTFRVLGKKAGIPVLFFDILKGWISVNLTKFLSNYDLIIQTNIDLFFEFSLAFGLSAVIGHLFPIFTGFRGGKGIATLLGFLFAILPFAAVLSLIVFILSLLVSRFVSLSSIIASFIFCVVVLITEDNFALNLFAFFVPLLSLITHQKNIERLLKGKETKVKFEKN